MKNRILSILLATVMCVSTSSAVYATEETITANKKIVTQEIEVNSDGWAVAELPVSAIEDEISPFGGGTEVWDQDGATVGTFTMTGNNLTPVKTIGKPYEILLVGADYTASKPVILTVQIRKAYTSTVLGSGKSSASSSGKNITASYRCHQGDKIQIYFRVTDKNGTYDDNLACKITYRYQYTGRDG